MLTPFSGINKCHASHGGVLKRSNATFFVVGFSICEEMALLGVKKTTVQIVGVLVTALLVNSNKFVLSQINFPAKSAALTFVHNLSTFIWIRLSSNCIGIASRVVSWRWLLLITFVGSLSVVASNLLLQITSVTFHQLSKIAALPAGAILDYYLYKKRPTWSDFAGLACVAYGILISALDERAISIFPACVAVTFVGGYLATAVLVRHVCTLHQITTSEFLSLSVPWGLLSSLTLFLVAYAFSDGQTEMISKSKVNHNAMDGLLPISLNLLLAVSVQWLSTWAASESSTMLYAIIGQAKTAATVILGVFFFQDPLSFRSACALSLCLAASVTLAAREAFEKESNKTFGKVILKTGKWIVALCFAATLWTDFFGAVAVPITSRAFVARNLLRGGDDSLQSLMVPDDILEHPHTVFEDPMSLSRMAGKGYFDIQWSRVMTGGVENKFPNFVCICDVDRGHIAMVLNMWITLIPYCPHFLAVATESEVVSHLEDYGVPYIFSQNLYDEVEQEVQRGLTPPYLAYAMRFKLELTLQLLDMGIVCFSSDADVAHLASMPRILFDMRRANIEVDIFSSAFLGPPTTGAWQKYLSPEVNTTLITNNGVAVYWPSPQSITYVMGLLSDRSEEGWGQINFVRQQVAGSYHLVANSSIPIYLGDGDFNTTIILSTAVLSAQVDTCLADSAGCLHFHAVGCGGSDNRDFSSENQIAHAKSRADALEKSGYWVLHEDWMQKPEKKMSFRAYLLSLDKRSTRRFVPQKPSACVQQGVR